MIIERIEVGPFASNCYVVGAEPGHEGIVIDPGAGAKEILRRIEDLRLDVKYIVLTHGHVDHIGALKEVKEATNAVIAIHADDAGALQSRNPLSMMYRLSMQSLPPADRLLKGGDRLDIDSLPFQVLHTPGHTPGGICLLGAEVVFTGDTLFNLGIGRTDMPGGSHIELMDSIVTQLMVLPDKTAVYPGHGPPTTIGIEREWNPFLRS